VRFVLIRKHRPTQAVPRDHPGLEARRPGWEALVVWHDDAALKPVVKMDWLPIEQLIPVPVDPNWTGG